jgi:membrane protein required for colicin V production
VNLFDLIVVVVIVTAAAVGTLRGGVRELLSLCCWVLAFGATWLFTDPVAMQIGSGEDLLLARMAAAAAVFAGTLVFATIAAWVLRRFVFRAPLGMSGRVLGAALGALRGLVAVLVLVILAGLTALPQQAWWRNSLLAPYYEGTAMRIIRLLPPEIERQIRYPVAGARPASAAPADSGRIAL